MSSIVKSSNIFSVEPPKLVDWETNYKSIQYKEYDFIFNTNITNMIDDFTPYNSTSGTNAIIVEMWEYDTTIGEQSEVFIQTGVVNNITSTNTNLTTSGDTSLIPYKDDLAIENNKLSVLFDHRLLGNTSGDTLPYIFPTTYRVRDYFTPLDYVGDIKFLITNREKIRAIFKIYFHKNSNREYQFSTLTHISNSSFPNIQDRIYNGTIRDFSMETIKTSSSSSTSGTNSIEFVRTYLEPDDKIIFVNGLDGNVNNGTKGMSSDSLIISDIDNFRRPNQRRGQVNNNGYFLPNAFFSFTYNYDNILMSNIYSWENHTDSDYFRLYLKQKYIDLDNNPTHSVLYPINNVRNIIQTDYTRRILYIEIPSSDLFSDIILSDVSTFNWGNINMYLPLIKEYITIDNISAYMRINSDDLDIDGHIIEITGFTNNGNFSFDNVVLPITTPNISPGTGTFTYNIEIELHVGLAYPLVHNTGLDKDLGIILKLQTTLDLTVS